MRKKLEGHALNIWISVGFYSSRSFELPSYFVILISILLLKPSWCVVMYLRPWRLGGKILYASPTGASQG